jgi:FixJ family two-component response regulator
MSPKVVVVVEDDPGMREALEKVLRAGSVKAAMYPSAETLLEAGTANEAGCLVLDIRLPGLSGLELYRQLSSRGPTPPVIFMTAFDDKANRREAEQLGAAAYFLKPFRGKELVLAIHRAMEARAAS